MPPTTAADRKIELKIDRDRVTVDEFVEALQELVGLVREVSSEMYGETLGRTKWVITDLRAGSALLSARPEVAAENLARITRVIAATANGLNRIEKRAARPKHFNDRALQLAAQLSERLATPKHGRATLRLGPTLVQPSTRTSAHVQSLTAGRRKSLGSLEGRLVGIAERSRVELYIEEPLRSSRVHCNIPEELVVPALAAFRRRVIVRGVIWETTEGHPRSIDVRSLEVLPESSELPTAADVRGILRRG